MELFPTIDRVIYQNNPLARVSCRIQFPERLELREQNPVEFHRDIRDDYPLVNQQRLADDNETPFWDFVSGEGTWRTRLSPYFVELATTDYERWETFSSRMDTILEAVQTAHEVQTTLRADLRYVDVISRQTLDLADVGWEELLSENLVAAPVAGMLDQRGSEYRQTLQFVTDAERGSRAELVVAVTEHEQYDEENVAVIDLNLFAPNVNEGPADDQETLEHLHGFSGRIFRGCISERLHQALGPEPVGEDA